MSLAITFERKIKGTPSHWSGICYVSASETSKAPHWIAAYCVGKGCDMGYDPMLQKMNAIPDISCEILFSSNCEIDYNIAIVLKVIKQNQD